MRITMGACWLALAVYLGMATFDNYQTASSMGYLKPNGGSAWGGMLLQQAFGVALCVVVGVLAICGFGRYLLVIAGVALLVFSLLWLLAPCHGCNRELGAVPLMF